jgi:hypothetical protein
MAADVEFNVKVRQVYKDCDERSGCDRWLTIFLVDEATRKATCSVMSRVRGIRDGQLVAGRATKIRLDRFRPGSTGYRLVKEVGAYE